MRLNLLVVGSENPRIRDFFGEVARCANVSYLDTSAITRVPDFDKLARSWRWRRRGTNTPEAHLLVPQRFRELSTDLTHWFCRRSFKQFGKADAVIFTWPQLCFLAEKFPDITRVYYCKDPFELWMWGPEFIRPLETRLLNNVDAVFAVSRLLTWDLAARTMARTFYLPNGYCDWFLPEKKYPRPRDLPTGRPVVCSVGQINDDYDWDYVRYLTENLPDVTFCFLGLLKEPDPVAERKIHRFLTKTPNVLWLGWRKYSRVPAYMHHCDILLNFLKADDLGNRRSPLRLYDYLTTNRPIISTGVAEAYQHQPHVHVAAEAPQAVRIIQEIIAGQHHENLATRREYAANQSWQIRARQFLDELTPIIAKKNPSLNYPVQRPVEEQDSRILA